MLKKRNEQLDFLFKNASAYVQMLDEKMFLYNVLKGDMDKVEKGIASGMNPCCQNGIALYLAVEGGHLDMLKLLLVEFGLKKFDISGLTETLLLKACIHGRLHIFRCLLRSGFDLSRDFQQALIMAAIKDHKTLLAALVFNYPISKIKELPHIESCNNHPLLVRFYADPLGTKEAILKALIERYLPIMQKITTTTALSNLSPLSAMTLSEIMAHMFLSLPI